MLWTPMKNKFVLFFILLLVNFDIFSGNFKKVAKEKFNPLPVSSIIDDQPSDFVDGPALTLGCTMCQQIMNLTVSHYPNLAATSIRRTILTEHCASLGLFSNICTKALNQYFTQIYNELKAEVEIRMKTSEVDTIEFDLRELCKKVGLCSGEKVPAFCKNYYVDDNTSPISMSYECVLCVKKGTFGLAVLKEQATQIQPYEKKNLFGKIMKNGAFFVFTASSESFSPSR